MAFLSYVTCVHSWVYIHTKYKLANTSLLAAVIGSCYAAGTGRIQVCQYKTNPRIQIFITSYFLILVEEQKKRKLFLESIEKDEGLTDDLTGDSTGKFTGERICYQKIVHFVLKFVLKIFDYLFSDRKHFWHFTFEIIFEGNTTP